MSEKSRKVLIVDGSQSCVMYLSIVIHRMGFKVVPAESGEEALKLARVMRPDLIVLDSMLGKMDGAALLGEIREDPRLSDMGAVVVSKESDSAIEDRFRQFGCLGYLPKPVPLRRLHDLLQKGLPFGGGQRRKFLRVGCQMKVRATFNGETDRYMALMLSEKGVYLRTGNPPPVDTEGEVVLRLGGKDHVLGGRIIYHRNIYSDLFRIDPGVAVEFDDIPPSVATLLSDNIKELLAGDIVDEQDEPVISLE